MIDTNVFVSIVVFNSKRLSEMLIDICENHILVLSSYILDELKGVIKEKFPSKTAAMDEILFNLPFELEYTPHELPEHNYFTIGDADDEPILFSAITADVDILITGDGHFSEVEIERPEILSPSEFLTKY
jgi:putative PIN family toxin of toxin-antitoxin system